jgi:hypothetical protein
MYFGRCTFVVLSLALSCRVEPIAAQHEHMGETMPNSGWMWSADASATAGFNYQQRKFTDFHAFESQNWLMLDAAHRFGPGIFSATVMSSFEPFTLHAIGSPQVYQTGETYARAPLIDYQHPHDLLMAVGASYRLDRGAVRYTFAGALVGAPALGPEPFMHRASGRDNPQAPLGHHQMDSTHITPGVLTAGVAAPGVVVEGSWFRGREPDEDRLDIDRPQLDSWSTRARWTRGPWSAQVSGGHLHQPETLEPFDVTRLTASVAYEGPLRSRPFAATLAWGENRERHGIFDAYLLEWDYQPRVTHTIYGRAESVTKEILTLGAPDPPGFTHIHIASHIDALTGGYIRDLYQTLRGRIGVGGDVTLYRTSSDLEEPYGSPRSFHVFVRYRAH